MIFSKKRKSPQQNANDLSETPEVFLPSAEDGSAQNISQTLPSIEWKRKRDIRRLIVSVGILLVVGVSLCFLTPYLKDLANHEFFTAPLIVLAFLIPYFWILLGWTLMQIFYVLGIIEINHTKLSKAIHIATLTLIILYTAVMLPSIVELTKCTVLQFQYAQNPEAFLNGFSYSSNFPLLLNEIETIILTLDNKSAVFTALGVILWLCKPDKQSGDNKIK